LNEAIEFDDNLLEKMMAIATEFYTTLRWFFTSKFRLGFAHPGFRKGDLVCIGGQCGLQECVWSNATVVRCAEWAQGSGRATEFKDSEATETEHTV
jgi:hypothetical protein